MKPNVATNPSIKPVVDASTAPPPNTTDRLRRFLEAYWLRPENAFWMTLRSLALAPLGGCETESTVGSVQSTRRKPGDMPTPGLRVGAGGSDSAYLCSEECQGPSAGFAHPSADVCCGDGVFTFLHLGGAFHPDFDVFQSVANLDRVTQGHADMFDHADEAYQPEILKQPHDTVSVGVDLKPALLAKADRLGLYGRLVEHDGNRALPFADAEFSTVYCNAAYWVEDIAGFLNELGRITRPGGRVILQVKLEAMRDYTLEAHRSVLGDRFMEIIGRGRVACWPSLTDRAAWEARFTSAGLSIVRSTPFVTKTHAHIWDIGLRPVAPMLVKMAGALQPETRAAIKREWVDLLAELLEPFCRFDLNLLPGTDEPAEIQYELTRA